MTRAVLFGFALGEGLEPVVGAPPWPVLARQLPRLVVNALNAGMDKGLRYFPFIGVEDGRRGFLELSGLLLPSQLMELHAQETTPLLLVDGILGPSSLHLRVLDGATGKERFSKALQFDPLEPKECLNRALFEITGLLEWNGRPPALPDLDGEALAWFLVAKDDLLCLEANLLRMDQTSMLIGLRQGMLRAPDSPAMRNLCLEIAAHMVRHGAALCEVADLMEEACTMVSGEPAHFLFTGGVVVESCGRKDAARRLYDRAARSPEGHRKAAIKGAALHFHARDFEEARSLCLLALGDGMRDPLLVAQLAAIAEQQGEHDERRRLFEELRGVPVLPATAARLMVGYLLEQGAAEEAVAVAARSLDQQEHAGLWLEKARAQVLAGDASGARESLRKCLVGEVNDDMREEVRRVQGFAGTEGILSRLHLVDSALARGDRKGALKAAKEIVRGHGKRCESWLLLGIVHQRLENTRRAERALRRALAIDADSGEAHNRLGILLVGRGATDEGRTHLEQAVALLPQDPAPRLHMAQACVLAGRLQEGREHLAAAERLGAAKATLAEVRRHFFGSSED